MRGWKIGNGRLWYVTEGIYSKLSVSNRYIEDICFFEVNTKYISSSELKTSEFSRVLLRTRENSDVFNSRDEIYLVFTSKKQISFIFYFYFIQYTGIFQFTRQAVKMQKPKIFENTNNFGTILFLTF